MKLINIKAYLSNENQLVTLKAYKEAQNIKFEISEDSIYNEEFVDIILRGDKDLEANKGVKISIEELTSLWK